jgi:hypothetical protein
MARSSKSPLPAGKAGKGKQQTETPQTQRTLAAPQLQEAASGPEVKVSPALFDKITKLITNAKAYYSDPSALPLTRKAQANCIQCLLYQVRGIENTEEWKRIQLLGAIRQSFDFKR